MNLKKFQYMVAIAEEGSISKAARKLHISQPSLSQYLQRLEDDLGTLLFERNTIPMKLTHAGKTYIQKAGAILALDKELRQELQDANDLKKGHLILGMTVYWGLRFLPKVLPIFHERYPGIEIEIHEGGAPEIQDWAQERKTDLTVMTYNKYDSIEPALKCEMLRENEAYLVLARNHPLAAKAVAPETHGTSRAWLDFSLLRNESFVLQISGCTLRSVASSLFKQYRFTPHISHEVQNSETAESLATAGIGAAFSLEDNSRFHDPEAAPEYFSVGTPPAAWALAIAWEKNKYLTQAARRFIELSREIYLQPQ